MLRLMLFLPGFNPYSIGSYSGRSVVFKLDLSEPTFQSLFYWKLLWKIVRAFGFYLILKLVSILILLEVTLEGFCKFH